MSPARRQGAVCRAQFQLSAHGVEEEQRAKISAHLVGHGGGGGLKEQVEVEGGIGCAVDTLERLQAGYSTTCALGLLGCQLLFDALKFLGEGHCYVALERGELGACRSCDVGLLAKEIVDCNAEAFTPALDTSQTHFESATLLGKRIRR